MLIATYNVNSIRSRMALVLEWLRGHSPDILCLQETKTPDDQFPKEAFEALGYHAIFRGEKSWNGVAMLCRQRPERAGFGFADGGPADESRLMWAVFGPLIVVNTYVPQGREITHPMYAYKQEWFRRLRRWFDASFRREDLLLWCGDLNVARTPDDVYDPASHQDHVCFHAEVRRAFEECLAWGFIDLFRRRHPDAGHYTFFDYRAPHAVERGIGWRIDYLLASPALAALEEDCFIDLEPRRAPKPSDHTVLAARFKRTV